MNSEPEPEGETKPRGWKQILRHEMLEYYFNFIFLAFFLVAFAWYRRLVLAEFHIKYFGYWGPLIEAAVLAKVIMIGDALGVGRRLRTRPLIVTTFYRTVVFSVFVGLFTVLEHIIGAVIHGKKAIEALTEIESKGWSELLASSLLVVVAFLPFFAYRELERVLGAVRLRTLFLHNPAAEDSKSHTAD